MYRKYYFAKVNINEKIYISFEGDLFNQDKFNDLKLVEIPEFILQFQKEDIRYIDPQRNNIWSFKDIVKLNDDIISGKLTKIASKKGLAVEGTKTSKSDLAFAVNFFYSIKNEIIAFENSSNIKPGSFVYNFENIFNKSNVPTYERPGKIDVEIIPIENKIEHDLLSNKIKSVKIHYVRANDPRTMDDLQNIFDGAGSKKGDIGFENDEGLRTKDKKDPSSLSPVFKNMVKLVKNGYGRITGKDINGNGFDSSSHPISKNIDVDDNKIPSTNDIKEAINDIEKERSKNS